MALAVLPDAQLPVVHEGRTVPEAHALNQQGGTQVTHRTAIARARLSAPASVLWNEGSIIGRVLDYGCGRGTDVAVLRDNGADITGFDPFYAPERPEGLFDTVLCTYVLNVIETYADRVAVLERIGGLLVTCGRAYVTVRRDLPRSGRRPGGTWQGRIILAGPAVSILERRNAFEVYELTRSDCFTTNPILEENA